MRIAVSSDDGVHVNRHFGDSEVFLIFEREGSEIKFLEIRRKKEKRINRHSDRWLTAFDLLDDCEILICREIGDAPLREARERNMKVFRSGERVGPAIVRALQGASDEDF